MHYFGKTLLQAASFGLSLPVAMALDTVGIGRPVPDIVAVDPSTVRKNLTVRSTPTLRWTVGNKWALVPRTLDGDWDRRTEPWTEYADEIYESIRLRYDSGTEWPETPYYELLVDGLETGETG